MQGRAYRGEPEMICFRSNIPFQIPHFHFRVHISNSKDQMCIGEAECSGKLFIRFDRSAIEDENC